MQLLLGGGTRAELEMQEEEPGKSSKRGRAKPEAKPADREEKRCISMSVSQLALNASQEESKL